MRLSKHFARLNKAVPGFEVILLRIPQVRIQILYVSAYRLRGPLGQTWMAFAEANGLNGLQDQLRSLTERLADAVNIHTAVAGNMIHLRAIINVTNF